MVIKLGTGVLTDERNHPDLSQMEKLVAQIVELRKLGKEVVLVSSGAVGAGMGGMGWDRRPKTLADLQACAAVGQTRLMHTYSDLFSKHGLAVGQVLLTHADLKHHERHLNARNTLTALLDRDFIPIVNENDAVSFTELKFGDNDTLSALVASLIPVELLVILTTADGLIQHFGTPKAKRISEVERIDESIMAMAKGTTSVTATGGMTTKIEAARIAVRSGIPMFIGPGRNSTILRDMIEGTDVGTVFLPSKKGLKGRKRWIAFFHRPKGSLTVDQGARFALRENGKSLLPKGVTHIDGTFQSGEVVRILDEEGTEFARGIAESDSSSFESWKNQNEEIIHRDNLVIL
jgi:glutamate 5-kinase